MLDLNHILLFIASISSALLLVRAWRGGADPVWRGATVAVLLVTGIAWLFARGYAGFIGAGAWIVLLHLPAAGLHKALQLAQRGHFFAARRILSALRFCHPGRNLREHERIVGLIEAARARGHQPEIVPSSPTLFGQPRPRLTPAVAILILLNTAMFLAESTLGGSTNYSTLHRLGALEPYAVLVGGEYWRLLAALFLHYGPLHFFVNIFALQFFGPTLESAIGWVRFAAGYLIAGIGSCVQVAVLWRMGWFSADQFVGASGAVMGIVGLWAGSLLRQHHLPHSRRTLRSIALIVLVQITFDLVTPQVSMAAHLGGLTTGFVLGLLVAPKRPMTL
ncbi:MAG: rhomboid family intramembrane serine protease [Chthoniobacterales bacterium]